jgi:hypothetical protein
MARLVHKNDPVETLKYVLPMVEAMETRIAKQGYLPTETPWGVVAAEAIRKAIKDAEVDQ